MKKNTIISLILLSTIILAWCTTKIDTPEITETTTTTETEAQIENKIRVTDKKINNNEFTLNDIAKHNEKLNCWTVVNSNVYDITSAFGKHPWWDKALLGLCGIEWTTKFNKQHGSNEKAKWRLEKLKIGILK